MRRIALILGLLLASGLGRPPGFGAESPADWRVGPTAWSFRLFTVHEAIEKTASLGMKYLEAFQGQRVSQGSDRVLDANLPDELIAQIRTKLSAEDVKLTSVYIHDIPGDEPACRKTFELARKLGVEFIVSEPAPEALPLIEKFCEEYRINLALHNHPEGKSRYWHPREVLKACAGRGPRIGACGDTGHWLRSGLKPFEAVEMLGGRLLTLHVKDLDEAMRDVPWGGGKGDIAGLFRTLHRLKLKPALFGIEYEAKWEDNLAEVAQCRKFFDQQVKLLAAPAAGFKVGAAAVVITPLTGTPLAGFYAKRPSAGVLDDLYAKAIVVEQDGEKAAFVALDLAYTTRPAVTAARELIAKECGIAPERVMISATHTHTGPVQPRDNLMDDLTGVGEPLAVEFAAKLPSLIARAVAEASAKLVPARASAAIGREEGVSFNRRSWMKDGTVAWQPPKLSPNIVRPAGPTDPDVGICYFESAAKNAAPLATYVNFAMHPTVMGGLKCSADYPGRIARRFAEFKGENMVTLFANGCCGNLNQNNPAWADPQHGPGEAERIGTVLAAAAFRMWPKLEPLRTFAPRARATMVTLPRRKITDAEVSDARRLVDEIGKKQFGTVAMANAVCVLDTLKHQETPLTAEVQAIVFSDEFAIVALPGEIFVELGLALKKASPFKCTFIAELANGSIGYVPNRSAYAEGQYEVVSARGAEGSGELLVDAALALLKDLRSPVPTANHPPTN